MMQSKSPTYPSETKRKSRCLIQDAPSNLHRMVNIGRNTKDVIGDMRKSRSGSICDQQEKEKEKHTLVGI